MPTAIAPFLANWALASRNPLASRVQPGVSALGKKKSTTVCFPTQSLSFQLRPSSSGSEKSGAFMPSFNMLPPWFSGLTRADRRGVHVRISFPRSAASVRKPAGRRLPRQERAKTLDSSSPTQSLCLSLRDLQTARSLMTTTDTYIILLRFSSSTCRFTDSVTGNPQTAREAGVDAGQGRCREAQ